MRVLGVYFFVVLTVCLDTYFRYEPPTSIIPPITNKNVDWPLLSSITKKPVITIREPKKIKMLEKIPFIHPQNITKK